MGHLFSHLKSTTAIGKLFATFVILTVLVFLMVQRFENRVNHSRIVSHPAFRIFKSKSTAVKAFPQNSLLLSESESRITTKTNGFDSLSNDDLGDLDDVTSYSIEDDSSLLLATVPKEVDKKKEVENLVKNKGKKTIIENNEKIFESDQGFFEDDRLIKQGCYERGRIKGHRELLALDEIKKLHCEQRLPDAIIFGVKKGGTTTLKEFLSYHPSVSLAPSELKFFNSPKMVAKGAEAYAAMMPFSTPEQIAMEKTPGYLVRPHCVSRLKHMLPNCKLIAVLRDPVKRAISDYVHVKWANTTRKKGAKLLDSKFQGRSPHYEIKETFRDSVLYENGSVKWWNTIIDSGLYFKHIMHWLQQFPSSNFLFLEAESFAKDPLNTLQKIENFLGIKPFFTKEHFYFDESKGFHCMRKPLLTCMPNKKSRPHPLVSDDVMKKLQSYFAPYNQKLKDLVDVNFSWTSYS